MRLHTDYSWLFFVISDRYPGVWSADMYFYRVRRVFVLVVIIVFAHKKPPVLTGGREQRKGKGGLVVFFPVLCAGNGFFPAAVADIPFRCFNARAEDFLDGGFSFDFLEILPEPGG